MQKCDFSCFGSANSETWIQALDQDPGPGPRKAWTLKNLDPKKSRP